MGRRGPPPTPTKILQMRGTFRQDRHGDPETEPQPDLLKRAPKPPEHLNDDAARAWKSLAKQLFALGLLSVGDLPALEAACVAFGRALHADRILEDEGLTIETVHGGLQAHPAHMISRQCWALYRAYAQEFGLTPSARTRVRTHEGKGAGSGGKGRGDDPWTRLAQGRKA